MLAETAVATSGDISSQLLRELGAIRVAVYAMLLVVIIAALGTMTRTYRYLRQLARKELGDFFRHEAQDLFEKGALDKLLTLANERIKERPNDAYAHWYLARIYRLREDWDQALTELKIVGRLVPEWQSEYVTPVVRAIEEASGRNMPANPPLQPPPADRRG
jgi:cytochrome c-type biogenesis protein CcmH/NrfG